MYARQNRKTELSTKAIVNDQNLPNATTNANSVVVTNSNAKTTNGKLPPTSTAASLSLTIDDESVFDTIDWAQIETEARATIRQKQHNNHSHDENYSESAEQTHPVRFLVF